MIKRGFYYIKHTHTHEWISLSNKHDGSLLKNTFTENKHYMK